MAVMAVAAAVVLPALPAHPRPLFPLYSVAFYSIWPMAPFCSSDFSRHLELSLVIAVDDKEFRHRLRPRPSR